MDSGTFGWMTRPLVGVITPVHNGAMYLAEAIDSVLAQSHENWRYIIADNASTDATHEIASGYAARDHRIEVVHFDELLPIIDNWNRAMMLLPAEAAYCKVLHADDWLLENCLERFVEVGERNPTVGLIGSLGLRRGGEVDEVSYDDYPGGEIMAGKEVITGLLRHIARANGFHVFGSPTNTMVRADFVHGVEEFYESDEMHADTDTCCRILMDSDWGFVREPLAVTRVHPGQNEATVKLMKTGHISEMKLFDRYGPRVLSRSDFDRLRSSAWDDYYRSLAEGVVQLKGPDFWRYHRERVHRLGESFRVDRIIARVPRTFCRKVINRLKS